jgi:hypothetical protein
MAGLTSADFSRPSLSQASLFAAAVAALAIFWDAAVGHGLAWENDPYWTYWLTKTFLIFTVFALGTAWLGIGIGRGAVITAVHTLVLTVYYWTLSPIGLPAGPEWLDLEHTWFTGLPIHFGVIYLGYLSALWLWLWRRWPGTRDLPASRPAVVVLIASLAIVVLAGGIAALAVGEWPGVTYFVVRLLITVPVLLLLFGVVGRDTSAAVGGAIVLAFAWTAYGEYVGPLGLPDDPLRVLDQEPPPADVHWLDYTELWLISLPIFLIVMTAVLLAAIRFLPADGARDGSDTPALAAVGIVALVASLLAAANLWTDSGGDSASVTSVGGGELESGEWFSGRSRPAEASLRLEAEDRQRKVTPLPPHDDLDLEASIAQAIGKTYTVTVNEPMVAHPGGRHTTWGGVGVDVWHHGESGIGSGRIPATRSDLAVFGIGNVSLNDQPLATAVPVHAMTGHGADGDALELEVGDPDDPSAAVPGLPGGHLRLVWSDHELDADTGNHPARYWTGNVVLALLLLLALGGAGAFGGSAHRRKT